MTKNVQRTKHLGISRNEHGDNGFQFKTFAMTVSEHCTERAGCQLTIFIRSDFPLPYARAYAVLLRTEHGEQYLRHLDGAAVVGLRGKGKSDLTSRRRQWIDVKFTRPRESQGMHCNQGEYLVMHTGVMRCRT
jgi:hypothetical protein